MPPHKPIIQKRIPVNDAVLKLGCLSINKINRPKETKEINFLSFFITFRSGEEDRRAIAQDKLKAGGLNVGALKDYSSGGIPILHSHTSTKFI